MPGFPPSPRVRCRKVFVTYLLTRKAAIAGAKREKTNFVSNEIMPSKFPMAAFRNFSATPSYGLCHVSPGVVELQIMCSRPPTAIGAWSSFSRDWGVALTRLPLCSLMNRNHQQRNATKFTIDQTVGFGCSQRHAVGSWPDAATHCLRCSLSCSPSHGRHIQHTFDARSPTHRRSACVALP